ncbi:MAG: acyltransferase [Actinobacteria bacterium]|nr:acyltransferase [Actinomycetota bacterium]
MALALASAWVARGGLLWLPLRALGRYPAVSWGLADLVYWTTQQAHFPEVVGSRPGATELLETATQTLARTTLLPLAAMLLVLPAVFGPQHRGAIRRLLRTRTMVWLGTVSYGIYLWHFVAIGETCQWILEDRFPESVVLQLAAVLALTLSAAAVSYYLLERPCVRLAQALTSQRALHL